tara:strand:+ start:36729 stop:37070 length:342 start_codon:yes stop_codon:yes gene_type:complete
MYPREENVTLPNGITIQSFYDDEGKLHRDGGPAQVSRRADGSLISLAWYRHGVLHREGGAAKRTYYLDGSCIVQWFRDGKPHRDDGPAWVQYNSEGVNEVTALMKDGKWVESL